MKKNIIKIVGILCFLILTLLTGCENDFDASGYIEALLDLNVKGDTDLIKEYIPDSDEVEELKEESNKQWEKITDLQLEGAELPEDIRQEYKEWFLDLIKQAKYTVGEAEKTENGYELRVDVEPISGIFEDLETPVREKCQAYYDANKDRILNGSIPEEEVDNEIYRIMLDALNENTEKMYYGNARPVTVEMDVDKDVNFSGFEEIGSLLVDTAGLDADFNAWSIWQDVAGFDAAGYVKALLDMCTKGDMDTIKNYLADDEEISQDFYSEYWENTVMEEFSELGLSEDVLKQWQDLFQKVYKNTKYTVGEAERSGDSYTVDVSVEPIVGIFDNISYALMEDEMTAYAEANAEGIANGTITETDIYNAAFSKMAQVIEENADNLRYADPQTVTVHVDPVGDLYQISDSDIEKTSELLVNLSELEEML